MTRQRTVKSGMEGHDTKDLAPADAGWNEDDLTGRSISVTTAASVDKHIVFHHRFLA